MHELELLFQTALTDNPALAFVLVYATGILTSFTPCVLPLVPITIGVLSGGGIAGPAQGGRGKALLMGLAYAVGMALMFSLLGLLAALSGKAVFGMLASSPITYLVMGLFIGALSLWMLKGDNIDPRAALTTWAMSGKPNPLKNMVKWYTMAQGGSFAVAFAIGFLSGIIAGPCTAPVIALVLAYVAQQGEILYGVSLMFIFGLGLSTIMVIAGVSVNLVRKMTKGGLMIFVHKALGVLMVLVSLYFFYMAYTYSFGGAELSLELGETNPVWTLTTVSDEGQPGAKAKEAGADFPAFTFNQEQASQEEGTKPNPDNAPQTKHFPKDFQGKVVFVTFWGAWCKECMAEIPHIKTMIETTRNRDDFAVLSVNVMDPKPVMLQTVKDKEIRYPVLFDPESLLPDRLEATAFPLNLFIGKDGKVLYAGSTIPENWQSYLK